MNNGLPSFRPRSRTERGGRFEVPRVRVLPWGSEAEVTVLPFWRYERE
ncbi:hypothetical protein HMPREF7215_2104 [Pyramidobacter piscolens W5455]|uniref:Uncharacterized protein n=1 Tax=Pyramidobacter piscolens W5455 TaxID=352165 RepID=A0ABM9ZU76_9BACT|nr:hypothetical protein HMPREF7215_2104 [Pyramidobacter piscolens W5455]